MAINPETEFAGKIAASSASYPFGEARNITVPGDGTGTPLLASLVNDIFGMQQAFLSAASIVPSGTPDKVGASQYLDALLGITLLRFPTLSAAQNADYVKVGFWTYVTERTIGNGGGAYWQYITEGTTAGVDLPNGTFIVDVPEVAGIALRLADLESATARQYGATGGDSTAALQAAIDNLYLDLEDLATEITSQLLLKTNVVLRAEGAIIKRQTGATPPFDMMAGTDLTGLDIRGLITFDGNSAVDGLDRVVPEDRFCGFRLIRCAGDVSYIKAINTTSAEIQAEGNRAAIMLEECTRDLNCTWLFASNNVGSGVFSMNSSCSISHVRANNHVFGSGFSSFGADDSVWHDFDSKTSDFSGISLNGLRLQVTDVRGEGAANGFANVNIGHDDPVNRADGSNIKGVRSLNSLGWGVLVVGSKHLTISDVSSTGSAENDFRIFSNSDYVHLSSMVLTGGVKNGLSVESGIHNTLDGSEIYDFNITGLSVSGGAHIKVGDTCHIHSNATDLLAFSGNVNVASAASVTLSGKVTDSLTDNILSTGANSKVFLDNAFVSGATGSNFVTGTGGTIEHHRTRLTQSDPLQGTFTSDADNSTTILNGNTVNILGISLEPANSAARDTALKYNIQSIVEGVSFTINFNGSMSGNEIFNYQLD